MDFNYSEDQVQLRDSLRRFIDDRYDFESRRRRIETNSGTDREMWARFAEMGWLAVLVPDAAGGLGWNMTDGAIIAQELGRGLVIEPFLEAGVLATRLLTLAATSAGNDLLSGIATGEQLVVPALAEAKSRLASTQTMTCVTDKGDSLVLNGRKILVAGGDAADHFIVSTTMEDGPALILVPSDAKGVTSTSYRALDGGWLSDVDFAEVTLSRDALLARRDHAAQILDQAIDEAALAAGAESVGCMERVLEITADYLRTRKQFGQPLADFQVLQHRMADLFVESEMARSALYSGLANLNAAPGDRAAAVSAARVRIDQAGQKVGNQGIHLHGGMGMTIEYPIGHYHRRMLVLARSFGDTSFHFERYQNLRVAAA